MSSNPAIELQTAETQKQRKATATSMLYEEESSLNCEKKQQISVEYFVNIKLKHFFKEPHRKGKIKPEEIVAMYETNKCRCKYRNRLLYGHNKNKNEEERIGT